MKNKIITFIPRLFGFIRAMAPPQNIYVVLSKVCTLNVKFLLLSGVMILSLPGLLYAQIPGEYEHDGFLLRFQLGAGGGSLEGEIDEVKGAIGSIFSLQLGGAINPNWAIHGGITAIAMGGDFESTRDNIGTIRNNSGLVDAKSDTEYSITMWALAISYYIMPINVYIAPEIHFVGGGTIEFDEDIRDYDLGSGSGFGITIGKEWWVSPNWGLGVALFYYQDTIDIEAFETGIIILGIEVEEECVGACELDSTHFGISFSATYN